MRNRNAAILKTLCSILMLTPVFAVPAPAFSQDITSNLAAHWKLDETSGTTAADSSGSGLTGTLNNFSSPPSSVSGKFKNALVFDGTNDFVSYATNINFDNNDFTISGWINRQGNTSASFPEEFTVFAQRADATVNGSPAVILSVDSTRNIRAQIRDDVGTVVTLTGTAIVDDQWYHLAMVKTGSDLKIYLNGVLNASTSHALSGDFDAGAIYRNIGRHAYSGGTQALANGYIDDVRVYTRALSAVDIKELYQSTPGSLRYKDANEGLEYHNADQWVHAGLGSYKPNAVNFDGTADNLYLASPLTDVSDGYRVTGSLWARRDTSQNGNLQVLLQGQNSNILVQWEAGDRFFTKYKNAESDDVLAIRSTGVYDTGAWHHIMWSADMNVAGSAKMYVDGVDVTNNTIFGDVNAGNGTNNVLDFTLTDYRIGANIGATAAFFNGDIADVWIDFGTYLDLTDANNRAKFISANGMPMYLGPNGGLPLGKTPDIFMSGDTVDWHTNKGTGGGFTENGGITDSLTYPAETLPNLVKIGNTLPTGALAERGLTPLGLNTVAYSADVGDTLIKYNWDGTDWTQIGNTFTFASTVNNHSISALDNDTIALVDAARQLETYRFNGTDWAQVGNTLTGTINLTPAASTLDNDTLAVVDQNNSIRTYSWDGTDWSQVGAALAIAGVDRPALATLNPNTVAFSDATGRLETYSWDGASWTKLGNTLAIAGGGRPGMTALSSTEIIYRDGVNTNLQAYRWNGTDWIAFGTPLAASGSQPALAKISPYSFAYVAAGYDGLETYQFAHCSNPTQPRGSILYNTDQQVMQYCNGVDWVAMGPSGGTSGTGCANPTGAAGDLLYNNNYDLLQYCNADDWIGVGLNTNAGAPSLDSLIAYWKFDEKGNTSTAADSSGYGHSATLTGFSADPSASWINGVDGGALDFTGAEYIDVTNTSTLDLTQGVTLTGWVNVDAFSGFSRILGTYTATEYAMELNAAGAPCFTFFSTIAHCSSSNLTAGAWYHITVSFDDTSDTVKIYINGALTDTIAATETLSSSGLSMRVNDSSSNGYDGAADDLRIYSTALTDAQVFDVYAEAKPCASGITLNSGQLCEDGTIFAGSGLYVAKTNQSAASQWKTSQGIDDITPDSLTDGSENHTNRAGVLSDFPAFEICENLTLLGHTDWYLPARDELLTLETNRTAIDANATDSLTGFFWSSSEVDGNTVYQINMGGGAAAANKTNARTVRCVRK